MQILPNPYPTTVTTSPSTGLTGVRTTAGSVAFTAAFNTAPGAAPITARGPPRLLPLPAKG
eukprot:3708294-Pyramimonas_sp.AAC.1